MIRAHLAHPVLTLDVAGPATMMESPTVQCAASEQLAHGIRSVRVDLRDCTTMDSTFTGTLLALKRQLDALGGCLSLVCPSPKVCELLEQMGLEDFYAIELVEREVGGWRDLATPARTVEKLRRVVVDAHDELARVPGPAARTFRAVADELRRSDPDLRRSEPEARRSEPEIPSSRDW